MLFSLTVGKVDAGVAVLLTQDKRLIEFPSILLPSDISSGSIVDITVSRNFASEAESQNRFAALQEEIYTTFGQRSPLPPVLRCRNVTQTSVVLEWDPIQLATAELRSLSLYRNGSKAGSIPKPLETQSTKISGLAIDYEYTFHLVLRTSAGMYSSQKLTVRTQKMTELSGITVTPGVLPAPLRESLEKAVQRIGARIADTVRLDTTHFVCTEGRGQQWERAVEMNIPVVRPEWVEGCEREGRVVGVRTYYLNADPRLRQLGQGVGLQRQSPQSQESLDSRKDYQQVPDRTSSLQQKPPQQLQEQHAEQDASTVSSDASAQQDGQSETGENPKAPTPPPKDEVPTPEQKSVRDEQKSRSEDRDQLGKGAELLNGQNPPNGLSADSEVGDDTKPGDGDSFSEVTL